jgi:hypothetical protein
MLMDKGFVTLIGMSIAYAASFVGMGLAWYGWKKRGGSQPGSER